MIERTHDSKSILKIVKSMFDDVVEDDTSFDCFELDTISDCWLSVDNFSALFHIKPFNRTALDLHCYIPLENRVNGKRYGLDALKWIKENAPEMYKKVITQTPSIYRHIRIYILSLGFEREGIYTKAFRKNGKLHDLHMFGIERDKI